MKEVEKYNLLNTKVKSMLHRDFDYFDSIKIETTLVGFDCKLQTKKYATVTELSYSCDISNNCRSVDYEITDAQYDEILEYMKELDKYL